MINKILRFIAITASIFFIGTPGVLLITFGNASFGMLLIAIALGTLILVFKNDFKAYLEKQFPSAATSSNREQSVPAKTRLVMLPIQRKDIEHPSEESLRNLTVYITDLAHLWISEKKPSRANLTISGYDDDPRELYEIPEVCQWANQTYNQFPSLLFFLTSASIYSFVGWLCGPESKQTVASKEFAEKFMAKRQECLREAITESSVFLQSIGADVSTISSFYFQSMEDFAREKE